MGRRLEEHQLSLETTHFQPTHLVVLTNPDNWFLLGPRGGGSSPLPSSRPNPTAVDVWPIWAGHSLLTFPLLSPEEETQGQLDKSVTGHTFYHWWEGDRQRQGQNRRGFEEAQACSGAQALAPKVTSWEAIGVVLQHKHPGLSHISRVAQPLTISRMLAAHSFI